MKTSSAHFTKLLVADDSQAFTRRMIERLDELDGLDILGPARDGREALELFERHAPHGLVLDLQMPEINGLEVLAIIRARDLSCLIIVLTFQKSAALRDRCLKAGADYFFNKSDGLDGVVEIISGLVKDSPSERTYD